MSAYRAVQLAELAILLHPCQPKALRDYVWESSSEETRELAMELSDREAARRAGGVAAVAS